MLTGLQTTGPYVLTSSTIFILLVNLPSFSVMVKETHKPLTGTEIQLAGEKTVKLVPEVAPAVSHWRERETSGSLST